MFGEKSSLLKKILLIAACVAALAVIIVIMAVSGMFKSDAEKAVIRYYESWLTGDGETQYELLVDPYLLERWFDLGEFETEEEVKEYYINLTEERTTLKEQLENSTGEDAVFNPKIVKLWEYDQDEVEKISRFVGYGKDGIEDIVAADVEIRVKTGADKDSFDHETVAVKIDGKWYVNNLSDIRNRDEIEKVLNQ